MKKRIGLVALAMICMTTLTAQQETVAMSDTTMTEEQEYTPVKIGNKKVLISEDGETVYTEEETKKAVHDFDEDIEIVEVSEGTDTTRIKIGNKGITIIEKDDKALIDIESLDDMEDFDFDFDEDDSGKFKGHWAGIGFGLNNYMDADFSLSRDASNEYMDLNTSKSFAFDLNFAQYSIGLGSEYIGLVTGLGIQWNNYRFDNLNSITKVGGVVVADTLDPVPTKSKLTTVYFNIPLLLEFQLGRGDRSDRMSISAGVIGGAKIGSYTKTVFKGDSKDKDKIKDDFNLSPFRYGYTARVGIQDLTVYAIYYPTPLFEENKGPELYPIQAGIALNF